MGTLHAWESFGDGVHPDIQAIAKGLGGGSALSWGTSSETAQLFILSLDMPRSVLFS